MKINVVPVDGMVITEDTTFVPGVYLLRQGIIIGADGVTLDGGGVLLVNATHEGAAVRAENQTNITIRHLSTSGFYHGLRFDHCKNVSIENVRVRDTAEIEGIDTFLYLWNPIEQVYGGAILLHDVQGGVVRNSDFQHQMNGVLLYGCSNVTIENNNGSFNSGWGVYLNASSDNVIQTNQLDFCDRVYRRPENGSIRVEADAAGIVLVEGSSRNTILKNSALCGGDGIYICGYDYKGGKRPCNDNLVEDNDFRLSPNNAIEASFSQGNIFRRNDCSRSNYGVWIGYARDYVLEDNHVEFNRWCGISIEHSDHFTIRNNRILTNGQGLRLFTRGGEVLEIWRGWETNHDFLIEGNLFENNRIGFDGYTGPEIQGVEGHGYVLTANTFRDNRVGARFHRISDTRLSGNTFAKNVEQAVLLVAQPGVMLNDNTFQDNAAEVIESLA